MKEAATGTAEIVRTRLRHTTNDRPELDDLTGNIHCATLHGYQWWDSNYEKRNSWSGPQTAARGLCLHAARTCKETWRQGQSRRISGKRTAAPFPVPAVADRGAARARQECAVPGGACGGAGDARREP